MSKVTVDDDVIDKTDFVLYFNPPLKAYMMAEKEDGTPVKVLADVSAFWVRDNKYSFEYPDPDCEHGYSSISDFCGQEELEFIVTHRWGANGS